MISLLLNTIRRGVASVVGVWFERGTERLDAFTNHRPAEPIDHESHGVLASLQFECVNFLEERN